MATIVPVSRVKGTVYKAIIRVEGIEPYSRTFKTRKAAQQWARQQENDIDLASAGVDVEAQRMLFSALCHEYMKNGWTGSGKGRGHHVDWWREQLGTVRVRDLSKQKIRAKLRDYKQGKVRRYDGAHANGKAKTTEVNKSRSPASVNRLRAALDAVLKYGRQEYDFTGTPTKDIPKETEDNERQRFLTEAECTRVAKKLILIEISTSYHLLSVSQCLCILPQMRLRIG